MSAGAEQESAKGISRRECLRKGLAALAVPLVADRAAAAQEVAGGEGTYRDGSRKVSLTIDQLPASTHGLTRDHPLYHAIRQAELAAVEVRRVLPPDGRRTQWSEAGGGTLIANAELARRTGIRVNEVLMATAGHWAVDLAPNSPGHCEITVNGTTHRLPVRVLACKDDKRFLDQALCAVQVADSSLLDIIAARAAPVARQFTMQDGEWLLMRSLEDRQDLSLRYLRFWREKVLSNGDKAVPTIQCHELVHDGESGSGLFNQRGELVGTIYAHIDRVDKRTRQKIGACSAAMRSDALFTLLDLSGA